MTKPLNQRTIANELGLSVSTVSKALRNHPAINRQTRAQVMEVAARLGYRSASRRGITRFRSARGGYLSIGMFLPLKVDLEYGHRLPVQTVLAGVSQGAARHDVALNVHYVPDGDTRQDLPADQQPPSLRAGELAGLLLAYDLSRPLVAQLASLLPCVVLGDGYGGIPVDVVADDAHDAMRQIVEHLVQLGHRNIGFAGVDSRFAWSARRLGAFTAAMAAADLRVPPENILPYALSDEDTRMITGAVERTRAGVTAWVCSQDWIGYRLYTGLTQAGLRVPEDVSITGYDALAAPADCKPLTSISQPLDAMGFAATRRLIERLRYPDEPPIRVQLACRLTVQATTGPAKA